MISDINYSDFHLADMWRKFDWKKIEEKLLKFQQKLTKAVFNKQTSKVKGLQAKIITSLEIRALAVHKISELNRAGPGIDGVLWIKDADKMRGAISLCSLDYKALPFKRIIIQDKHKNKKRHIGVPTIKDRAMQMLYTFTLSPIAEATADRKSFAFRKGRSTFDAHYFICASLMKKNAPEWVFVGDIKACYESISHEWLLANIPMDRKILKEFLKAGFAFKNEIFPTEQGISLGSNISPILGNMTLDGLQKAIFDLQKDRENVDYDDGNLIRFADDILITARTKKSAEMIQNRVKEFLGERGLILNEQKSKIIHATEEFDFLSRNYIKYGKVLYTAPSKKAIQAFEDDLRDYILNNNINWSQRGLIEGLNAKLRGWATYHRVTSAQDAFRRVDAVVSTLLLQLTQKLYPTKTKEQIIEKFWYSEADGTKFYAMPSKKEIRVMHLRDILIVNHTPLKTKANPYLEPEYFKDRVLNHDIIKVNEKYKATWRKQRGKCYYCGEPIGVYQDKKFILKNLTGDSSLDNMAYIHASCDDDEIVFCHADLENPKNVDVFEIIKEISEKEAGPVKYQKRVYRKLEKYFCNCLKPRITLSFCDIEKIIDAKMCNSAYKYTAFWYKKGRGTISDSWQSSGFGISRLDIKNERVTFKKVNMNVTKLQIPEVFLTDDVPNDAQYELENFFDYIKKKYRL
ncbi:MAG: reverse transcriptase N-terminal domain-containing protein [Oscillospiraceae bacterium]|jgi:RNA-directed DNA polymerase|nr:reverse transcriptase N-terminal domain-containing protein [Oscillospiraceae bacterium]